MKTKILLVLVFCFPLWGFVRLKNYDSDTKGQQGESPVILDWYAASQIHPGGTWRVYLRARDKDGDMKDITTMLVQPGAGFSPTEFTRLNGQDRNEFVGYLFMRTPPSQSLLGDKFKLRVFVRDREGNRSKAVYLPLAFSLRPQKPIPDKWQHASKHRLGVIPIELSDLDEWRRY